MFVPYLITCFKGAVTQITVRSVEHCFWKEFEGSILMLNTPQSSQSDPMSAHSSTHPSIIVNIIIVIIPVHLLYKALDSNWRIEKTYTFIFFLTHTCVSCSCLTSFKTLIPWKSRFEQRTAIVHMIVYNMLAVRASHSLSLPSSPPRRWVDHQLSIFSYIHHILHILLIPPFFSHFTTLPPLTPSLILPLLSLCVLTFTFHHLPLCRAVQPAC